MYRRRTTLHLALSALALSTMALGFGMFVYGYAVAPMPEAPELYQRGYSSFVSQQEHSGVWRGIGATLGLFGLLLAAILLILWFDPTYRTTLPRAAGREATEI